MREFCNIIDLYLLADVQSLNDNTIALKPGRSFSRLLTDEYTVKPVPEKTDAGILYNVEMDITIDKVPASTLSTYRIARSAIIRTETLPDHAPFHIGSPQWPAIVYIIPNLNQDSLRVSWKTPRLEP